MKSYESNAARDNIPEWCYSLLLGSNDVIIIKRNENGYHRTGIHAASVGEARVLVDKFNVKMGVTRAQEEAMKMGSMFGWNITAADPNNYDVYGRLKIKGVMKNE